MFVTYLQNHTIERYQHSYLPKRRIGYLLQVQCIDEKGQTVYPDLVSLFGSRTVVTVAHLDQSEFRALLRSLFHH